MLIAVVISFLSDVFGDKYCLDAETRNALIITANGPAIWGRLCSRFFPEKAGWRTFCRHGTIFIEHYECRAEGPDRPKGASWGTICLGARNLSRRRPWLSGANVMGCRIKIACRCAHPERSEGRVQEPLQICLECRSKSWGVQRRNPALAGQKPWQTTYPYCPCYI